MQNESKDFLEWRQRSMAEHGSCAEMIDFLRGHPDVDIQLLQHAIVARGMAYDAYRFAKGVKGADIHALQDVVLKDSSASYAYAFASDIAGADIPALQQAVIDSENGRSACLFAIYVPSADIDAVQDVVMKHGSTHDIFIFAREIAGADWHALRTRLAELCQTPSDFKYLDELDKHPPVTKHRQLSPAYEKAQKKILESGSGRDACRFARENADADILKLQQVVLERGTGLDALNFANDVPDADKGKLLEFALGYGYTLFTLEMIDWLKESDMRDTDRESLRRIVKESAAVCWTEFPVCALIDYVQVGSESEGWIMRDGPEYFDALIKLAKTSDSTTVTKIQKFFSECADGYSMRNFCNEIPGADVQLFQSRVLSIGTARDAYIFAKDVNGVDLQAIHKRLTDLQEQGKAHWYLELFSQDKDIQSRMREQTLNASATAQSHRKNSFSRQ